MATAHFEDTSKPYDASGAKSPCAAVLSDLRRRYLTDYAKGNRNTYEATRDRLGDALYRAAKNREAVFAAGTDNPYTRVDELVEYLRHIKARPAA